MSYAANTCTECRQPLAVDARVCAFCHTPTSSFRRFTNELGKLFLGVLIFAVAMAVFASLGR